MTRRTIFAASTLAFALAYGSVSTAQAAPSKAPGWLSRKLALDRGALSLGLEAFGGFRPLATGLTGRVQVDLAGQNTGNRPIAVSASAFADVTLPALMGFGYGGWVSSDPKRTGAYGDVRVILGGTGIYIPHHPVYKEALGGFFVPGLGGMLVGRNVIGVGGMLGELFTSAGGYVFVQHPAIGWANGKVIDGWNRVREKPAVQHAWAKTEPVRKKWHATVDPVREKLKNGIEKAGHRVATAAQSVRTRIRGAHASASR